MAYTNSAFPLGAVSLGALATGVVIRVNASCTGMVDVN